MARQGPPLLSRLRRRLLGARPSPASGPLAGQDLGAVYAAGLDASARLLRAAGEDRWATWTEGNLERWRAGRGVEQYLAAFGGASSPTNVALSHENGHRVTPAQEPWVNAVLRELVTITWAAAARIRYGLGPPMGDFGIDREPAAGDDDSPPTQWARREVPALLASGRSEAIVRAALGLGVGTM